MANSIITASPLSWPAGWPRAMLQEQSRFGNWGQRHWVYPSIDKGFTHILHQLKQMGVKAKDVIISTDLRLRLDGLPYSNQRQPEDVGAAVYWTDKGSDCVMALDQYDRIGCNLWAIGKSLEALRRIERWGGGQILDRAFAGFMALPSPQTAGGVDPYTLIGISPDDEREDQRMTYRKALAMAHPDRGGDAAMFDQLRKAGEQIGLH